ncbi:LOW QUALITY PROTEIN: Urease accessory protein [Phytophthora palmivora]|uniref:Urease accessory protein n=1 Tax=Phytophthora palmivora TaxID=4796 RepID=A0A2P4Y3R6_9STRA|nr:LOW QUALITY PROTEIN: Urease accessory protein [Phytophthora palmivora]
METSTCQICLDAIEPDQQLTNVCGKSCSAEICRQCLGRHVDVTLQHFYPGVLPRIRCPICLTTMHMSRWEDRVPDGMKAPLTVKYTELCHQACIVTPPCCHKTDYSHLPVFDPSRKPAILIVLLPSQLKRFKTLCKQFCRHILEPRVVLDYAFATFGEEKATILINEMTLYCIQDSERRATLLLSLIPTAADTISASTASDEVIMILEFDEDNDLVRCRTCRALLLKVEGCDAVNCVCGFNMNWAFERSLRQERKKGILPVDIFDIPLTNDWLNFRTQHSLVMKRMRSKWLSKRVIEARPVLRPAFAVYMWRFRLRKVLNTQLSAAWRTRRAKLVDQNLAVVREILRGPVASLIWRRRFSKALASMERDFYWSAYRRSHTEEIKAETEEVNTLFSIATFDDE